MVMTYFTPWWLGVSFYGKGEESGAKYGTLGTGLLYGPVLFTNDREWVVFEVFKGVNTNTSLIWDTQGVPKIPGIDLEYVELPPSGAWKAAVLFGLLTSLLAFINAFTGFKQIKHASKISVALVVFCLTSVVLFYASPELDDWKNKLDYISALDGSNVKTGPLKIWYEAEIRQETITMVMHNFWFSQFFAILLLGCVTASAVIHVRAEASGDEIATSPGDKV